MLNRIEQLEKRCENFPTLKSTIALALRQWLAYSVADVKNPKEYLQQANYTIVTALRKNESDLRLFWLAVFFAIELNHFDKAREMLDRVYPYRSFYKSKQPKNYKILYFLYALMEIRQKRIIPAEKYMEVIEKSNDSLLLGILHLELSEYQKAHSYLIRSYQEGCRSIFLCEALFRYYHAAHNDVPSSSPLFIQIKKWAANQRLSFGLPVAEEDAEVCLRKQTIKAGYYDEISEQKLNDYMQQQHYKSAVQIILDKGNSIRDKFLWSAIKTLAEPENEKWHKNITTAAYNLLVKSRYDKNILNLVLTNFDGFYKEWLDLHNALSVISIIDERLDEVILKNAAWSRRFDEETQRVFAKSNPGNLSKSCLQNFIYCAVYSMIIKKIKPINEAIAAMEKICMTDSSEYGNLLAYGLSHMYFNHNVSTNNSESIINLAISAQEKNNLLFPVFKSVKTGGKKKSYTYIEKYRPFMYKTLPGKNVYLYYKEAGEEDWRTTAMRYWRFGIYLAKIPHFYNESLSYYYSEELPTGSISTKQDEIRNMEAYLTEETIPDPFFKINNATIYEQMFRYDQVEEILSSLVKDVRMVRSKLM